LSRSQVKALNNDFFSCPSKLFSMNLGENNVLAFDWVETFIVINICAFTSICGFDSSRISKGNGCCHINTRSTMETLWINEEGIGSCGTFYYFFQVCVLTGIFISVEIAFCQNSFNGGFACIVNSIFVLIDYNTIRSTFVGARIISRIRKCCWCCSTGFFCRSSEGWIKSVCSGT